MKFYLTNETNTDVILCFDAKTYIIKSTDSNICIDTDNGSEYHIVSVKRLNKIQLPNYDKILWTEILGGVAALFTKSYRYIFDVSSEYRLFAAKDQCAYIKIVRTVNSSNPDGIYDAIRLVSDDFNLNNVMYCVENKSEISKAYKKSNRTARLCMYIALEIIVALMGMIITYPFLFVIRNATGSSIINLLFALIPILLVSIVALIGILPLHYIYKVNDKNFYKSMEHEEICSYIK